MKLQSKIVALVVPLVVIPLAVLGWLIYDMLGQAAEQRERAEVVQVLDSGARFVEMAVDSARANMQLLGRSSQLRNYALSNDESERYDLLQRPLLRGFADFMAAFPACYEVRFIRPDGFEDVRLTSREVPNRTEQEFGTPFVRDLMMSELDVYSAFVRNPDNGEPALMIGQPLVLGDPAADSVGMGPRLRGYLSITVDLAATLEQIARYRVGKSGFVFLTDANGEVLVHAGGQVLSLLAASASRQGDGRLAIRQSLFARMRHAAERGELQSSNLPDGVDLIQGKPVAENLYLFVWLPDAGSAAQGQQAAALVVGVIGVTVLVTVLLVVLAMRYLMIRPIRELGRAVSAVGEGDYSVDLRTEGRDELHLLARSFADMTGRLRESSSEIQYIAYHDVLTGLPNRHNFNEFLGHTLARAERELSRFALLFLDLDDFKKINDTLGHEVGDRLLQKIAERLKRCLRDEDFLAFTGEGDDDGFIARLGGDEFIVLLPQLREMHEAGVVAQRLINLISRPLRLDEQEFHIGVSVGITVFPDDATDVGQLVKFADIAMYAAKQQGKNGYQYYAEAMNVAVSERVLMEKRLRSAIDEGQFSLHYQPQVDGRSGRIAGMEALIRWNQPEAGFISPADFIHIAEDSGLVMPLGEWVIREACRQNKAWQDAGLPRIPVSVNVSGVQIARAGLLTVIKESLMETGLPPEFLEVEVTETAFIDSKEAAIRIFDQIRALGVKLALDDFGTGYSSLNYLREFTADKLKIDRCFVEEITHFGEEAAIIRAIITMAHALKVQVVAEGVEQAGQFEFLSRYGCDLIQGHYFSGPLPAEQMTEALAHNGFAVGRANKKAAID